MNTRSGLLLMAILASYSLLCAQTGTLADYMYLSDSESTMESGISSLGRNGELRGRIHTNGMIYTGPGLGCILTGLVSTHQLDPEGIPYRVRDLFHGGFVMRAPLEDLDLRSDLQRIRSTVSNDHHYIGYSPTEHDTLALTTYLKFNGPTYAVAQYLTDGVVAQTDAAGNPTGVYDTLYVTPGGENWLVQPLPNLPGEEVIVVEGVCRLEGFVEGRITVMASDSMFLMDDLVASDVILDEYGNEEVFGRVPAGSENCIGLISENNIILANTLPNGAFNGGDGGDYCPSIMGAQWTGGPATPANIQIENSSRQDVVITASLIALGCVIETEYWHTSAVDTPFDETEGTGEGIHVDEPCERTIQSHIAYWPCYGDSSYIDRRGTLWFDGSLVQTLRGFRSRTPVGPWDHAVIGYMEAHRRYDQNLYHRAPPMWPGSIVDLHYEILLPDSIDAFGTITPRALYALADHQGAGIYLQTTLENCMMPEHYRLSVNGELLPDSFPVVQGAREIELENGATAVLLALPRINCTGFTHPGDVLNPALGPEAWNRDGSECNWVLETSSLELVADSLELDSGPQPHFALFARDWNSSNNSFRITETSEMYHIIRLVNDEGVILAASETEVPLFQLPELEEDLYYDFQSYRIHVEAYAPWSDSTWTSEDSYTWWHNDAPSMAWMQAPPDCGRFASRSAFLSAWNSAPPVLQLADMNIDSIHVQLKNRGESLREWTVPATHIATTLELGVLSEEDLGDAGFELSLWIEDRLGFPPEDYEPCTWWYNPDTDVSPPELPQALSLRAFPNPFNPSTTVELALPRSGEVKLTLYNLQGRQLRVIREAAMAAGLYHIPVHTQRLASGLYLLRVEAPGATGQRQQQVHKLLLVR